jgi:hypothetical protein
MAHAITSDRYPVCFQVWRNGEWQKSATHTSDVRHESGETHFQSFCDRHDAYCAGGNSLATLIICNNAEEEREALAHYFDE